MVKKISLPSFLQLLPSYLRFQIQERVPYRVDIYWQYETALNWSQSVETPNKKGLEKHRRAYAVFMKL